jgi:hypothetical protein
VALVELARPPESVNLDHDLFDIVLSDLIDNEDFEPATGGRRVEKCQIVFGDTTLVGPGKIGASLAAWFRDKPIPDEVKNSFLERNPQGKRFLLAGYQPSNSKILVRDLRQVDQDLGFASQFPDARGYVESYLPAYSRDGRTALVLFSFGPTPHGAIGCYLLHKASGFWMISERMIAYLN